MALHWISITSATTFILTYHLAFYTLSLTVINVTTMFSWHHLLWYSLRLYSRYTLNPVSAIHIALWTINFKHSSPLWKPTCCWQICYPRNLHQIFLHLCLDLSTCEKLMSISNTVITFEWCSTRLFLPCHSYLWSPVRHTQLYSITFRVLTKAVESFF